ncbi:MAG: hypothetical protein ACREB2_01215, partial [Pseudolabrys sp.]
NRTVAGVRDLAGRWAPMASVELIVVVAYTPQNPAEAEVFCFDSRFIVERLEESYQRLARPDKPAKPVTVVFVKLNAKLADGKKLAERALWREVVPVELPQQTTLSERLMLMKQEIAAKYGVEPAAVTLEIKIKA